MSRTYLHRQKHNDIVRYVKQQYIPTPPERERDTVAVRTETVYATKPSDPNFRHQMRYRRLQNNLSRGFFTEQHVPFQTIGECYLDDCVLFCELFNVKPPLGDHAVGADKTPELPSDSGKVTSDDIVDKDRLVKHSKDAGLSSIKEVILEANARRRAVQSGQSYIDHLMQCQLATAKKKAPTGLPTMVIQKLTSQGILTNAYRMESHSDKADSMKAPTDINCSMYKKLRLQEKRLLAINVILISLKNFKTRYLRRRSPLTWETVMSLRKPITQRFGSITIHTYETKIALDALLNNSTRLDSQTPTPRRTSRISSSATFKKSSRRGVMNMITGGKKDTWEDIILDTKGKRQKRPWHNTSEHRTPSLYLNTSLLDRRSVETKAADIYTVPVRQEKQFQALKDTLQKVTQIKLDKQGRDKSAMYNVTVRALRALHHRWEHKNRVVLSDLSSFFMHQLDLDDTVNRMEPWFEKLRKEVHEFIDHQSTLEAQLKELQQFAYDTNTPVSNAKEKLCLLSLSLPIYEICLPVFKEAFWFVMEEIYFLPKDLLRQWLTYRHIYEEPVEEETLDTNVGHKAQRFIPTHPGGS